MTEPTKSHKQGTGEGERAPHPDLELAEKLAAEKKAETEAAAKADAPDADADAPRANHKK